MTESKHRDRVGGGVALLVKQPIEYYVREDVSFCTINLRKMMSLLVLSIGSLIRILTRLLPLLLIYYPLSRQRGRHAIYLGTSILT